MKRASVAAWITMIVALPVFASSAVERCTGCHGDTGISENPSVPMIAGFSDFAIIDLLASYNSGFRPERELELPDGSRTSMVAIAADLSDAEIDEVARFFSQQTWVPQAQTFDAVLAARGRAVHEIKCAKCHSEGGSEPLDDLALLAGQWREYLTGQVRDFDTGARRMAEKMQEKYETLSAADKAALIEYYVGGSK